MTRESYGDRLKKSLDSAVYSSKGTTIRGKLLPTLAKIIVEAKRNM